MLVLKRKLQEASRIEDFDTCITLRNELQKIEKRRDGFDVVYETSRFIGMMTMEEPSNKFRQAVDQMNAE